jgi:hypothetical protein
MFGRGFGARLSRPPWLGTLTVVPAAVLVVAGLTATPPAPSVVTVDTARWYVLVNKKTGQALEVHGAATGDGARIAQASRNDAARQQWRFVDSGGGFYRLRNRGSGKVLDVPGSAEANGTGLVQWSDSNGTGQQFRIEDTGGGYVQLINRDSNKAVGVAGSPTAGGAGVVQWTDLGKPEQQWLLLPVHP